MIGDINSGSQSSTKHRKPRNPSCREIVENKLSIKSIYSTQDSTKARYLRFLRATDQPSSAIGDQPSIANRGFSQLPRDTAAIQSAVCMSRLYNAGSDNAGDIISD